MQFDDFDTRPAASAPLAGARVQARDELRRLVPGVEVRFDAVTGAPSHVMATGRFLAPAAGGDAVAKFVNAHAALFGHDAAALVASRVTRDDTTAHNGLRTVVWQQQVDGVPFYHTILKANVTKDGALAAIGSHFVPDAAAATQLDAAQRAALVAQPPVDVKKAIALAAADLGDTVAATDAVAASAAEGAERRQRFTAPGLSDTVAGLAWLPMAADSARLAWDVTLMSLQRGEMFRTLVDVQTGEVLLRTSLTADASDASYRVYADAATKKPYESPRPMLPGTPTPSGAQAAEVPRTLVTLSSVNPIASPNGWIDDGGTETLGNNVDAHTDVDADNLPDLPRPTSATRVFDFALALVLAPSTYREAAVTQLFYLNNWMHDQLYALGFTESAGNFQTDNFGRGGLGNDAVDADAQDGGGTDNANMSTPPDGSSGRMQMYVFTGPSPDRDSALDAAVVLHEYTHGLSNRLVGGGVLIGNLATRGMGEGWSDFYGLALLADPASDPHAVYPFGAYVTLLSVTGFTSNHYYGFRRYPYSTDLSKNPLTFRDIDPAQASPHSGIPLSPRFGASNTNSSETHNVGEVWCVALWECRVNLVDKYGPAGNQRILQLVTDGMKLCPANPNFLEARDAIIQADLVNSGGADRHELWAAFAKRGMGASAYAPASTTTTGVGEAFDLPDALTVTPLQPFIATGTRLSGPFTPGATTYTLTNTSTTPISWTVAGAPSWLSLAPSSGALAAGGSVAVVATINSSALALAPGTYSGVVALTNFASGATLTRAVALTVNPYLTLVNFFPLDTDPLWSRGGEWAFGHPTGGGAPYGDPTSGATGLNVFGINLNGTYNNVVGSFAYLTTGPLNLTGATDNHVRFRRWLNASSSPIVPNTVDVSIDGETWTNIWTNNSGNIQESAWNTVTYPLGSIADDQPTVYLRWGHRVGLSSGTARGGWNIDDIAVLTASATATLAANAATVSTPHDTPVAVTLTGSDSTLPGGPLAFALVGAPANGSLSGTLPSVTYTPAGGFSGVDTFTFTVSNGSLTSSPAGVTITVAPGGQEIVVEQPAGTALVDGASTVAFGSVPMGSSTTRRFAIRNAGAGPLTLLGATVTGSHALEFSPGAFTGTTLQAGEEATFEVTFAPAFLNAKSAVLHIQSDDFDEASFEVALTGSGTVLPTPVQLARDINRTPAGLAIGSPLAVGGQVFFLGTSFGEGQELWRTDGTAAGTRLVKDISSGQTGGSVSGLTDFNGTLFFAANDGINGTELWKSDGTAAGTVLVKDINAGAASGSPANFAVVGGMLFFAANDGINGAELWKSDGTAAGTVLVANIAAGATSSSPASLRHVNGTLFFAANNGVAGVELWKSDGTAGGTVLVSDIRAGSASSTPTNLAALGNKVFFRATDGVNGAELWSSDGTSAGTVLVKDINAGAADSFPGVFTSMGGALFFTAITAAEGPELWRTDGTAAGTVLMKDIYPGPGNSSVSFLTVSGGKLFFAANEPTYFQELWVSDGTPAGTARLADVAPNGSANPTSITAVGDGVFFAAKGDGASDIELWKSDGTASGTVRVKDIYPGGTGSAPANLVALGGLLLFSANDGLTGQELWRSDGTEAGTVPVLEGQPGTNSANIQGLRAIGSTVFFSATDGVNGQELWRSDGTLAGTTMVRNILAGIGSSNPTGLTAIGSTLFFAASSSSGTELWKSDGTAAGTVQVSDIMSGLASSSPTQLTPVGATLFFSATVGTFGAELWLSDGTAAGTTMVLNINPTVSTGSSLANLTNVNGTLFFSANDGTSGAELWKSDGTPEGTVLVKDIFAGSSSSSPANFRAIGSTLFFTANNATSGTELWKSDGTAAGTVLVADLVAGTGSSSPGNLTVVGATLYFSATTTPTGTELWKSDGTTAGTVLVRDIVPGSGGSAPAAFAEIGGALYFRATTSAEGSELWKSDGTAAGTVLVRDIFAGAGSSAPAALASVAGLAYFTAATAAQGAELWKSDGTAAGTTLVSDLAPGAAGTAPANLTVAGDLLFFTAQTSEMGPSELFVIHTGPPAEIAVEQPLLTDLTDGAATVDFGVTTMSGSALSKTFTIRNVSTQPLLVTGIVADGPDAASFSIPDVSGVALPAAGTANFTVTFQAVSTGAKTAAIHIGSNDADENPFDIALTATVVVAPEIALEQPAGTEIEDGGTTISFGAAVLGEPVVRTFTVRNVGAATLNLGAITIDGAEFVAGAPPSPAIPAGGSVTFDVTFNTATVGAKGAVLHVASDDLDESSFDVRLIGIGSAPPGQLRLVRDINQAGADAGATSAAVLGGSVFFAAATADLGAELWKSDGTEAGTVLVRDIMPGAVGSNPANFVVIGSTLYFSANSSTIGVELWKSDGTTAGTVLVRNINASGSSNPTGLRNVGGTLFFAANDGINGLELWKSDGTTAGTVLVADIEPGVSGSSPLNLTVVGTTLFFSASTVLVGRELWKSDGTAAGTTLVLDIHPSSSSFPGNLTAVGGTLFFTANEPVNGTELWKSDGTAAGTVLVRDLEPGTASSLSALLVNAGGTLFFQATTTAGGAELWKSDGTDTGTVQVRDIVAGAAGSTPTSIFAVGSEVFFAASTTALGSELWKSDGTDAGTVLVLDINPGAASSTPSNFQRVGGVTYFSATTADGGTELWRTGGRAADTVLVKEISAGPASAAPAVLTDLGGALVFFASNGPDGAELWRSDGTGAGTSMVKDIAAGSASAAPSGLRVLGGAVLFSASDGIHGAELWRSDGLSTTLLKDIAAGSAGSNPGAGVVVGSTLYFPALQSTTGTELWRSDGTPAGTVRVRDIFAGTSSSTPTNLTRVGSTLFFSATGSTTDGAELWKSDGSEAGTVLVANLNPTANAGSSLANLTDFNGTLFFSASDGTTGTELWKSDGTAAGTVLVKDIYPGSFSASLANLRVVGATLYFTANDGVNGVELWKSDGTAAGTVLVADLAAGVTSSSPASLTVLGSTLYFFATTPATGVELWKTDGTAAGTVLVKDIFSGTPGSSPANLVAVGTTLFFTASNGSSGVELWKSDGTAAGTVLVKDIVAGSASSGPTALTPLNGALYFTATTTAAGAEPWRSDGTAAGTVMIADLRPGSLSSSPANFTAIGSRVFFTATGPDLGSELWALESEAASISLEQPAGTPLTDGASTVTFPSAIVGAGGAQTLTFTIRNTASFVPLAGIGTSINGSAGAEYSVSGPAATILNGGQSTTFVVTFAPTATGPRTAALHIASNDPDGAFDIALAGTGLAPSPIQAWRLANFGTVANTGSAADAADFDGDGVRNLLEFAFGTDPTHGGSLQQLPQPQPVGANYVVSFAQPAGAGGITYGAEWSPSLAPASWTPIPDTGSGVTHTFSVPIGSNERMFLRIVITAP